MKVRLLTNSMRAGHVARDFIDLAHASRNSSTTDAHTGSNPQVALEVLNVIRDYNRAAPTEPVVPIKRLVRALTEGLHGVTSLLADDDGKTNGARLFRGCPVRLRGIPERRFVIREILWDYEEVRIGEVGTNVEYVLPWDCIRFSEEQQE